MTHHRYALPVLLFLAMNLAGCISRSESGRVYLSFTPLIVIGAIIWIIAMIRR